MTDVIVPAAFTKILALLMMLFLPFCILIMWAHFSHRRRMECLKAEESRRRLEAENRQREGEYRVIRTKDGTFWVQKFIYGIPDPQYYDSPKDVCWHWKFLAACADAEYAMRRQDEYRKADAAQAALQAAKALAEKARRAALKDYEVVEPQRSKLESTVRVSEED